MARQKLAPSDVVTFDEGPESLAPGRLKLSDADKVEYDPPAVGPFRPFELNGRPSAADLAMSEPPDAEPSPMIRPGQPNIIQRAAAAARAAPGKAVANPREASRAFSYAATRAMGMALDSPEDIEARVARFKAGTQTLSDDMTRVGRGNPNVLILGKDPNEERLAGAQMLREGRAAAEAQPVPAMVGEAIAPTPANLVAGPMMKAIPAATILGKIARGAATGATLGAIGGGGNAAMEGGGLADVAKGAGFGALGGAVAGGSAEAIFAGVSKALAGAPALAAKQEGKLLTRGADATHARRAMGKGGENLPAVTELADQHPALRAAAGNAEKVAEVTEDIANKAHAQVGPAYDAVTSTVGPVNENWVLRELDSKIAAANQTHGRGALSAALQDVRNEFADTAAARQAAGKTLSHQDLRGWVTEILKNKQRTVGSLNESKAFELVGEIHQVADSILRDELAQAGHVAPQLAPQLAALSAANKQIAVSLSIKQAAENAMGRELTAKGGVLAEALHTTPAKLVLGALPATERAVVRGAAAMSKDAGEGAGFAGMTAIERARQAQREQERRRARMLRGEPEEIQ